MKTNKATPREWKQAAGCKEMILDQKNYNLGEMVNEADAELIVRAVNCHDDLVHALDKAIIQYVPLTSLLHKQLTELLKRARGES